MRRKMIVLAIGVAGLLVVFALLAFAYTPHIAPTVAPVNAVVQPAQMDNPNSSAVDDVSSLNDSNATDPVQAAPQHQGRCDHDSASNAGY